MKWIFKDKILMVTQVVYTEYRNVNTVFLDHLTLYGTLSSGIGYFTSLEEISRKIKIARFHCHGALFRSWILFTTQKVHLQNNLYFEQCIFFPFVVIQLYKFINQNAQKIFHNLFFNNEECMKNYHNEVIGAFD